MSKETTDAAPLWRGHTRGAMKVTIGVILAHVWGVDAAGLFDVHIARFGQPLRQEDAALFVAAADTYTGLGASHDRIAALEAELSAAREELRRANRAVTIAGEHLAVSHWGTAAEHAQALLLKAAEEIPGAQAPELRGADGGGWALRQSR